MNNTIKIFVAVVAIIIAFTIIQRIITPKYIETVKTETRIDSTAIDSLTKRIQYLENIPPDTTIVKIPIPQPDIIDSTYHYKFPFADSLISSITRIESLGEITDYTFEYYYRAKYVEKEITTITEKIYLTKIITKTKTEQPRAYLSLGGEVGYMADHLSLSPKITYTKSNGESFGVRYDVLNQGYYISYTRPIRFKLPF